MYFCSCRYPTNKWQKLGTFHARDERTVQSFPLDEHLYAKYVKVSAFYFQLFLLIYHATCRHIAVLVSCRPAWSCFHKLSPWMSFWRFLIWMKFSAPFLFSAQSQCLCPSEKCNYTTVIKGHMAVLVSFKHLLSRIISPAQVWNEAV